MSAGALQHMLHPRLGLVLPRPTLLRVREACRGNPFFALEIGTVLEARGTSLDPSAPLPIPTDVQELVRRRLAALSTPAREALMLTAASAEPEANLIERLSGWSALEEALAAGVVLMDGTRLRFTHPLFADALNAYGTPRVRREIHARLADALPERQERALHLALATEASNADVANELERAAVLSRGRGALAMAAQLYEEAARVTPSHEHADAARRTLAAAYLWVDAADHRRAAALAQPLVERLPPGGLHADALVALSRAVADRAMVAALHERALAEVVDDAARQVPILFGLGYTRLHLMDVPGGREVGQAAVRAAEQTSNDEWRVLATSMLGRVETFMAGRGQGAEILRRSLELEATIGMIDAYDSPAMWLGWWHLASDDLAEARQLQEKHYRAATDTGDEYSRLWLCYPLTELECRAGEYAAAARYAERGREGAEAIDSPYVFSALHYARALVGAHVGDVDAAKTHAEASRVAAGEINSRFFDLRHSVVPGLVAAAQGNHQEAATHLGRLYALRRESEVDPDHFYSFWPDLVEGLVAIGELEQAESIVAERAHHELDLDRAGKQALIARCRGLIAAARGRLDEALEYLGDALALHQLRPVTLEHGRTLFALGQVQRRAKRKRSARESLEAALDGFERRGARLWAERAQAELARIGGRMPSRGRLTATEQRLAALVAVGKTNKEVAAELFVTVHTIEAGLTRIYSKLGVRSRTELAAYMVERSKL